MKVLFIGGTGNISTAVSKLAIQRGMDLHLINRGIRKVDIPGAKFIRGDISNPDQVKSLLKGHQWDVVVNWIAYTDSDINRDLDLFRGKTRQYIFISSASAYQKPLIHPVVTESTPLANPYWEYSRDKIACEERLNNAYRNEAFPMTIVRPSLTYDTVIPVALGGWTEYNIIERMRRGNKVIVHGDGTSLWTITHSEDFAKGFVGLMGHQQASGHAFHITSDEILTWNQIYQAVAEAGKIDESQVGNLLGDKATSVIFDNTKIKTFVPDFQATIPFKEGIKRTVAWFEENPGQKVISEETDKMMDRIIQVYEGKLVLKRHPNSSLNIYHSTLPTERRI
jgi:nucleoside-diphosphate-sugar epimerase